jgi:hypothetical protein
MEGQRQAPGLRKLEKSFLECGRASANHKNICVEKEPELPWRLRRAIIM